MPSAKGPRRGSSLQRTASQRSARTPNMAGSRTVAAAAITSATVPRPRARGASARAVARTTSTNSDGNRASDGGGGTREGCTISGLMCSAGGWGGPRRITPSMADASAAPNAEVSSSEMRGTVTAARLMARVR